MIILIQKERSRSYKNSWKDLTEQVLHVLLTHFLTSFKHLTTSQITESLTCSLINYVNYKTYYF